MSGPVERALGPFDAGERVLFGAALIIMAEALAALTVEQVQRLGALIAAGAAGVMTADDIAATPAGVDAEALVQRVQAVVDPMDPDGFDVDELIRLLLEDGNDA